MFICGSCKTVSQPRERMNKVVVQTRVKPTGGKEIAKEMNLCTECNEHSPFKVTR